MDRHAVRDQACVVKKGKAARTTGRQKNEGEQAPKNAQSNEGSSTVPTDEIKASKRMPGVDQDGSKASINRKREK